jgi:hypothetical protein
MYIGILHIYNEFGNEIVTVCLGSLIGKDSQGRNSLATYHHNCSDDNKLQITSSDFEMESGNLISIIVMI